MWAELQHCIETVPPCRPDEPDVVFDDFCNGASKRNLVAARDNLASARSQYDEAVRSARVAGLSWADIGALLRVSRQQLHRRYRSQVGPNFSE